MTDTSSIKQQFESTTNDGDSFEECLSDPLVNMWTRIYLLLLVIRFYFAISPSYIHPDENFQGPEIVTGESPLLGRLPSESKPLTIGRET